MRFSKVSHRLLDVSAPRGTLTFAGLVKTPHQLISRLIHRHETRRLCGEAQSRRTVCKLSVY